ncbi:DnaJ like protein subfamily A member 2 [Strigomonas culicis]|uniref:DnaJ like protein subfamily A member 2 n=1 Tax=Strigomonas culicis TaxID=28005 RepID=S9U1I4_9TRYP|nr:DnaJ like protein subfamily A member 2 [Strigomonas culicis]EPY29046.1 DnaJ like protein subfamily A member 2 [Strigomonas culicis]EPY34140.1 DnaJ like protein subfamily A member 2 [Strigomonas culicis]|eukprot:EPY22704.1 DnaJ like protein subfamily A member 2 [Strigomonas culicis]
MVKETEFYELLHVAVEADEAEIKRSYRRLALRYHPDKNPGDDEAAEMFKKVSHAYETLSDPEKRTVYDKYGKAGLDGSGGEAGFHDASDIFSMFFGGHRPRGEPKPKDLVHELPLTLEEMFSGKTVKLSVLRNRLCHTCGGNGLKAGAQKSTCRGCQGHGVQIRMQQIFPGFVQQAQVRCQDCGGEGTSVRPSDVCRTCAGKCVVQDQKQLDAVVAPGAAKNEVLLFEGEGNQVPGVRLSGDIMIVLEEKPHPVYRRIGRHLLVHHALGLKEALCGFHFALQSLDGRLLDVTGSPGQVIDPEAAWELRGEGMPSKDAPRGSIYIIFKVNWPTTLTATQVNRLAQAFELPARLPLVGGQVLKLEPYTEGKKKRGAQSGGPGRGRGPARQARRRQNSHNEEEYEEDFEGFMEDDDDEEEMRFRSQGCRGGSQVECGQM